MYAPPNVEDSLRILSGRKESGSAKEKQKRARESLLMGEWSSLFHFLLPSLIGINSCQQSRQRTPRCSATKFVTMDAFTPQQTIELVSRIGTKKAHMRMDKLFVNSLMSGPLLGFGCAVLVSTNASPWYVVRH